MAAKTCLKVAYFGQRSVAFVLVVSIPCVLAMFQAGDS